MSREVSIDPARRLDLHFRIARNGDLTFPVYGSDSLAYSLVYEDFTFFIKRYAGERNNILELTVGAGITLSGNEIQIDFTTAQTTDFNEGEYYWELINVDDNETWLSGKAFFHNGPSDAVNDDISIELQTNEVVNIYINL